ncbi:hypothetical protein ACVIGB_000416 [Bradyrhizobium sp. USDA 4341]
MFTMIRKSATSLLIAAMVLTPTLSEAAGYPYFRMYGHGGQIVDGGQPQPGSLGYAIQAPVSPTVGGAFSGTSQVSGAVGAPTFSVQSGSLPAGTALNSSTGAITGTLSAAGTYFATLKVVDTVNSSGFADLQVVVSPVLTAGWAPAAGKVAEIYVPTAPTASGGRAPFSYSLSGVVPAGLVFSQASGLLTGTPTAEGSYSLSVTIIDADGRSASTGVKTLSIAPADITVPTDPALTISGTPGAVAQVGVGYSAHFSGIGGTAPYVFGLVAGSLPPGLTLSPDGVISGVPLAMGTYSGLQVRVTDAASTSSLSAMFSIDVQPEPQLLISGNPAGTAWVGSNYSATFTALDGSGAGYSFSLASGSLPPGLSLAKANVAEVQIVGTPTHVGTYSDIVIRVTDSHSNVADSPPFSIVVAPIAGQPLAVTGAPAANGEIGSAYLASFSASGGTNSGYSFSIASGALPAGLSLSPLGLLSGTPSSSGTFKFAVAVADSSGDQAQASYSITILDALTAPTGTFANGEVGLSYTSAAPSAHGGLVPYAWSLASGSLPAGLSLDRATGMVSGLPTTATAVVFTLQVTDALGVVSPASSAMSLAINSALTIAGSPAAKGEVGASYAATFSASGGTGSGYAFSVVSGALPAGLTLSPAGVLSGVPTSAGNFGFTVVVTDPLGGQAQASYSITILDAQTAPTAAFANGEVGVSYASAAPSAHGGLAPYAWSLASGSLPAGLSLDAATGVVSGLPTTASSAVFTLRVTDALGIVSPASSPLSLTINSSLTIAGTPAANGEVAAPYLATFTAAGGTGSGYVFSIASGALPAGLTLSAAGSLTGSPIASGTFGYTVAVADSLGGQAQASYSVTILDALTAPTAAFVNGDVGVSYLSAAPSAHGGLAPYAWSLASGTLPAGLSLDSSTGVVSGMPTAASTATFTLRVTDSLGIVSPASSPLSLTINSGLAIAGSPAANGEVGTSYSATFTAVGGAGSGYVFSIGSGALPPGLTLSPAGSLTGTPTAAGGFNFTVAVADALGGQARASYSITILDALTAPTATFANGDVGVSYVSAAPSAHGGLAPYVWSLASGSLPTGLSLDASTGVVSGLPTTASTAVFTLRVTDALGVVSPASSPISLKINPALAIAGSPAANGEMGVAYNANFSASGGAGSGYVFSIASGALPAGLTLSAAGSLTGTPTASGTFAYTVAVADSLGGQAQASYSVTILNALMAPTAIFNNGEVGVSYTSAAPVAHGGLAPYVWSLASGSLPTGLSLDSSTGVVSGMPTAASTATFTLRVTDALAAVSPASSTISLKINPALTIAGAPAANGEVGVAYTATFSASGGSGNGFVFSIASGALPPGLALSSGGVLSGVPTSAGNFGFTVAVADALGGQAQAPYSIAVSVALTAPTGTFANGEVGVSYTSAAPAAHGGLAPYVWSLASGSLPAGLSLNSSTGVVSGMPTAGSTATFTLQVTDSLGSVSPVSSAISLTINSGLTIAGTPPANGEVGTPYSATFSASGGTGSGYVFSLSSGTLPAGLALSTAGSLTGTPTASGTFGFTVAVVDGAGGRGQASHSVTISDALTAPTAAFAGGMVGVSYTSAAPAAHGGLAPYNWSLASGSLPAGLSLDGSTGIVSGVPTTASTSVFTLKVTDTLGVVSPASSTVSVTIDQVLTISSGTYVLTVGSAANLTPAIASGGSGSYTNYAAINGTGTLAALGLSFNSSGTITGTPTATGSWTGSVVVTDSHGHTATSGQITIYVDQPLSVSGTPAAGQVNSSYNFTLAVSGGTGTYPTYSVANTTGTLAALGLSFSAGKITGPPSASGTWSGTITVTDSHGTSKTSGSLTIKIDPALVISGTPAQGNAGVAYSFIPAVSGGSLSYANYAAATTSGSLGTLGLVFTQTSGKISGSSPVAGSWTGTITVTDSDGNTATSPSLTIQIVGPLTISGTPTTGAVVGSTYNWTPAISGGTAPYTVSYTTSSGPTLTSMGLSFSATTGTISGNPMSGGVWNGTISVTDAANTTVVSSALSLSVAGAAPTISGGPLKTPWAPNVAMPPATFTATGGVQPYTWSLVAGTTAVPAGVSISSSGVVSGTPTANGTYNFNVKATNATGGQAGTMPVSLVVSSSAFVTTSNGYDGLTVFRWPGFPAAPLFTPSAYNASGSVTWTMTGQGASGLSINPSTGAVSGTLSSTYGTYPLTVTGTDSASHTASFLVTLDISHRSGSSGTDPLNATIYLNGVSCGTGTVGAATCTGTLTGANSTLELVYPNNVQSSQVVFNATTWPSAVNLEVSYGDGVSYSTCATGSVSSGTPSLSCSAGVTMYATHYRVRVISMTGSMSSPGLKVNAYFDPP